eukprot:9000906-Ditylum_brightwellii.AAC.1
MPHPALVAYHIFDDKGKKQSIDDLLHRDMKADRGHPRTSKRPLKEEKYRVRLTIGGDRLVYDDKTASPAASLLETKIIVDSTISDASKGAQFMGIGIKDVFLQMPLPPGKR